MKETLYINEQIAILNFSASYARTPAELLNSPTFKNLVESFIDDLETTDPELYAWAVNGKSTRQAKVEITKLFRELTILECDEVESYYLNDKTLLLDFIEELYNFWKRHQRFSVTNIGSGNALQESSYVTADSNFNRLIRDIYRNLEQKVQGRKNKVYRQLQAGTNAAAAVRINKSKLSARYDRLKEIPMFDSVMLRTPLLLTTRSNKRTGMFVERADNPVDTFSGNADEWFCFPAKIGSMLAFIYFHRDFIQVFHWQTYLKLQQLMNVRKNRI